MEKTRKFISIKFTQEELESLIEAVDGYNNALEDSMGTGDSAQIKLLTLLENAKNTEEDNLVAE